MAKRPSSQTELDFSAVPPPRARRGDPVTSHISARMAEGMVTGHDRQVMDALLGELRSTGGTGHEIAAATGLNNVQVMRRIKPLRDGGLVEETEDTRPSPSGRPCTVWRAKR